MSASPLAPICSMRGSIRASGWDETMSDVSAIPLLDLAGPSRGLLRRRRVLAHKGFMFGAGLVLSIVLVALLAPLIAPHDPYAQDLGRRLIPPVWYAKGNWTHLL